MVPLIPGPVVNDITGAAPLDQGSVLVVRVFGSLSIYFTPQPEVVPSYLAGRLAPIRRDQGSVLVVDSGDLNPITQPEVVPDSFDQFRDYQTRLLY